MAQQDHEHLRLLSILHYVLGGLVAALSLFSLLHIGTGLFFIVAPEIVIESGETPPPPLMGWLFLLVGMAFLLGGLVMAGCLILSGRFLSQRRHYWFSFVVACLACVFNMPLGTLLGIFTLVVLSRDSVKRLYGVAVSDR